MGRNMAHSKDMREDEAGETVRGMTMQHLVIHINNVVVVCLFSTTTSLNTF